MLCGIITLAILAVSSPTALWASTVVDKPDLPSDFWNAAVWPEIHSDTCAPNGQEYRSTGYARIINDKKWEAVLATMINGTIITYEHAKGGTAPDFGYRYFRSGEQWVQFDLMNDDDHRSYRDTYSKKLLEYGISDEEHKYACQKLFQGFEKFWNELDKKAGIK